MGPFPIELCKENGAVSLQPRGARDGTRTHDLLITNQLRYQLRHSSGYSVVLPGGRDEPRAGPAHIGFSRRISFPELSPHAAAAPAQVHIKPYDTKSRSTGHRRMCGSLLPIIYDSGGFFKIFFHEIKILLHPKDKSSLPAQAFRSRRIRVGWRIITF